MAKETTYEALPVDPTLEPENEKSDEERAFEEFVNSLGAERMGVLRVGKLVLGKNNAPLATSKSEHCFSCPIDQYTYDELLEYLRDNYGPGLYRILGIPSGDRVRFNKIVAIAQDKRKPNANFSQADFANPTSVLETVSKLIADSQARTEALIERLAPRASAQHSSDPTDTMVKLAGVMSAMMQGIAGLVAQRPQSPGGDDFFAQLEKFARIKELLGGFGDSGESNFFDVVKTGIQSFAPVLSHVIQKASVEAPKMLAAAPAVGQAIQSSIPGGMNLAGSQGIPAQGSMKNSALDQFKSSIDGLVTNARNGVDPVKLADTILSLTPKERLPELVALLESPDVIARMAEVNPEVLQYREYFETLRAEVLAGVEAEPSEERGESAD